MKRSRGASEASFYPSPFSSFILHPSSFALMDIGFVGLGKMGANMSLRLARGSPDGSIKGGHRVVGFAKSPAPALDGVEGVSVASSLEAMVEKLPSPKIVWVMVPS